MVSRLKGEKSEGGCEASFLAGETSGLTNLNPSLLTPRGDMDEIKIPPRFILMGDCPGADRKIH
jgi:hypothetical protein